MRSKKMFCFLIVALTALMLTVFFSHVMAEEDTDENETRTSAQYYPFYDPFGFYDPYYGSPYTWQYSPYSLYGGLNPFGYGFNLFGIHNLYYPVNFPGTNFVFQYPFIQIAPYIGATTFWQNQFPNADWNNVLAGHFLGLIDLPGLPYLF